jgi:hypothetical protein
MMVTANNVTIPQGCYAMNFVGRSCDADNDPCTVDTCMGTGVCGPTGACVYARVRTCSHTRTHDAGVNLCTTTPQPPTSAGQTLPPTPPPTPFPTPGVCVGGGCCVVL